MKKTILIIVAIMSMMTMSSQVMADAQPGAVMAVNIAGADELYPTTEVYIKGVNLVPYSTFTWDIYDKDVTCPPGVVNPGIGCAILLHSGSGGSVSSDKTITPLQDSGWSIPNGDYNGHQYKLVVTIDTPDGAMNGNSECADIYTKVDSFSPTPEVSTIIMTSVGIVGLFLISRKHKKD